MSNPVPSHARPREGWILAGTVDGVPLRPAPFDQLGGLPHALRLACDLAMAGVTQVYMVWAGDEPPPDLAAIAADPRLSRRASFKVVREPPPGPNGDAILVVRGDRVFHRDVPKIVAQAYEKAPTALAKIAGDAYDAVFATDRGRARTLAAGASQGRLADHLAEVERADEITLVDPPYLGFTVATPDARALRRAEGLLVSSLRKAADGLAAKAINRHISLPLTRLLCRTPVMPNHVTLVALACALAGGLAISRGGYLAGVVGMLLVEAGSIIDGIDGELARLRFQFSRGGQWLDTIVDDIGNVAYSSGVIVSLDMAGVTWAVPFGIAAICAFVMTQTTQYLLIRFVYNSGDLAAIPWAFQSAEFLSQRPTGLRATIVASIPKLLKRDFVVTMFLVFALFGRLEPILLVFGGGAFGFFAVFFVQFLRNVGDIRRAA